MNPTVAEPPTIPYRLAVCAETLFADQPLEERIRRLSALGYGVELWSLEGRDIKLLSGLGAEFLGVTGHRQGSMVDPADAEIYIDGVRQAIATSLELGCRRLVLHTSEIAPGGKVVRPVYRETGEMWLAAHRVLSEVAELAERSDVEFGLENLNRRRDHVGSPLSTADDVTSLVRAVDSPRIRVLLDIYHAQVDEGDLITRLEAARLWLGEIQVADVPGRHEPGTGEIAYPAIAARLREWGWNGVVALEAWPSSDDELALRRFDDAFARHGGG